MVVEVLVKRGAYQDSVRLMQISKRLSEAPGVKRAAVMMGTPQNKEVLRDSGMFTDAIAQAEPSDMVVAVMAETSEAAKAALVLIEDSGVARARGSGSASGSDTSGCRTIAVGIKALGGADLAMISVPGPYAAAEALKALKAGLNVFLFSDNVSLADEVYLKRFAHDRGLLVMGPDCGTAWVGGVPLGFVNAVRRGTIGIVGASGTGMQEVMSIIHRQGAGISHAFGTGGRDLSEEVGGITMLEALSILAEDIGTEVIVCVSKPPAARVANLILARVAETGKPAVVCFLGGEVNGHPNGVRVTATLQETAELAVSLARAKGRTAPSKAICTQNTGDGGCLRPSVSLPVKPGFVRALFSGGSLADEALTVLKLLGQVYSNLPGGEPAPDLRTSTGNTVIDMGSDEFTVGRPHPMIDFSYRVERFRQEAEDPEVSVILMDVVLGFGAHPDPAAELAPAIEEALMSARRQGRGLAIVLSVVGTDLDPQGYTSQVARLKSAGAIVCRTNFEAAKVAAELAAPQTQKATVARGDTSCR